MELAVGTHKSKRFLHYGRRSDTTIAVMLMVIALYLSIVVVRSVASGRQHAHTFWPAIGLLTVLATLACVQGLRVWRRARSPEDH
jgi:hypothetical protein